jgi:pyruvate ferredoxin oxidoreductase gamma subunit
MFEVRVHGRVGQGVVTAAELLSIAAFLEGRHAQAFPGSGSERTDAPVVAFCRIDDREIRTREPIAEPDALIVQDPTLLGQVPVFDGLRPDGFVVVNSGRRVDNLDLPPITHRRERWISVPATELARKITGRPVPNAALLGAFAAVSNVVSLDSVTTAILQRFRGSVAAANASVARIAYQAARTEVAELERERLWPQWTSQR